MKKTNILKIIWVFILMLFLVGGTCSYYVVKANGGEEPPQTEPETQEPQVEGEVVDPLPPITEQGFFTRLFGGFNDLLTNPQFNQIMNWVMVAIGFIIGIWAKIRSGQSKVKAAKAKYDFELLLAEKTKLTTENEAVKAVLAKAVKQADAMKKAMILAFDRSNLKEDVKDKIKGYFDEVEQLEEIPIEKIVEELEEKKVVEPFTNKTAEFVNEEQKQEVKPLEW
ncbi:MAG: hypothetical protein WBK59_03205 [Acholeplasmatales bacterium]